MESVMHSFRQKVFTGYVVALCLLFALMIPLVISSVHHLVLRSMNSRADELVLKLQLAQDEKQMVSILKDEKHLHFFRISVTNQNRKLLYDSHVRDLKKYELLASLSPLGYYVHNEIEQAFQEGEGYSEQYSHQLGQRLIYIAKKFDFYKQPYVLRLAFPYLYIQDLKDTFTIGFFLFSGLVLLLFALLSALIVNRLSAPIREITKALGNYKEGHLDTLPNISLKGHPKDEFSVLADTITSLANQLKQEIAIITAQRNERDAILEAIQAGVILLDEMRNILYLNSTARQLLNVTKSPSEVSILSLLPIDLLPLLATAHAKKDSIIEDTELKKNQETRHINLVIIPQESTGGTILVLHDRSNEYRMLEMRKAFIANASHELKTPITIIRGFAEMLNEHPDLQESTRQEVTKRISDSCSRMTSLIRNLLLLSDIENLPSHHMVEVDLIQIIRRSFETISHAWPEARLTLYSSTNTIPIKAAPELLEMACTNLLNNGVKYSDAPAECFVRLEQKKEQVVIQIQDKGVGISKEDLPHIFQRFFRGAKAGQKKYAGSGLGLSITETIVAKHGGTIFVESTPNCGTTCTITLPQKEPL